MESGLSLCYLTSIGFYAPMDLLSLTALTCSRTAHHTYAHTYTHFGTQVSDYTALADSTQ